jgi:peptide methionine sulfoxide reductase msrA/msrB
MDFLSGLLLAIGGFFGFGMQASPEQPMQQNQEQVTRVEQEEVADTPDASPSTSQESESSTSNQVATKTVDSDQMIEVDPAPPAPVAPATPDIQTALVAGGCFWCVEADLEKTPGVIAAVSGYAGGATDNPTYDTYKAAGHREVVEVTYDANQVSFEDLLIVTMKTTDPTDDDGTFGDRGDGYSAAFYYETAAQRDTIESLITEVDANGPYDESLAIDVESRPTFYVAEDYHQDYYKGTLTKLKYKFYRDGSGRTDFINKYWGTDTSPNLPWRNNTTMNNTNTTYPWSDYVKPDMATLEATMDPIAFKVTQKDGTERAGTSPLDKVYEPGIYVDVLSGEPLYSSRDKFDSGTGWPSFVAPITPDALTEHEDRKLFSVRTETRSAIADNHIGHVFNDGPADRGGLRYCMNGVALRFVPEADMEAQGYADFLSAV